jgi:hypothetical protein
MRARFTTLLSVIGAVTVLVLAGNTVALATTGHALLLGKANAANRATVLSRTTPGTALVVKTKSSANAPFAVNGKGRVTNLNADTVDGLSSNVLRTGSYVFNKTILQASPVAAFFINIPLPAGTYLVSYAALLQGANVAGSAWCYLVRPTATPTYFAESRQTTTTAAEPGLTGTALITLPAGQQLNFDCQASTPFYADAAEPIQVVATPTIIRGASALRMSSR